MATPKEIERQVQLERTAINHGIQKLRKNTKKLEQQEYASASVYGVSSIQAAQGSVAKYILETFWKIRKGQNGKAYKEIHEYLNQFEDEKQVHVLANIALKKTFDNVFNAKTNRNMNSIATLSTDIGKAVENECQIRWYEEEDPKLLSNIQKKYWHNSCGTRQKIVVAQTLWNRQNNPWKHWSVAIKCKLGAFLLEAVCQSTGWFQKEVIPAGNPKLTVINPTPEYLEIQEKMMDVAEMYASINWPMLVEPNDWTNERNGGYLLNELINNYQLIRRGNPTIKTGDVPLKFLNNLQKVGYRINQFTYEVALHLKEKGEEVGDFKPLEKAMLWEHPPKPPNIDEDDDARQKYKRESAESYNELKKYQRSLHVRTTDTMFLCDMFRYDNFYLPWSFDYRGRCYPLTPYLTPQDTDFGKSLLKFTEQAYITPQGKEWLAFQVATTYGLDKKTIQERLIWVDENISLITKIALNPIDSIPDWEVADEPWQFLAACDEYYHVCIACDKEYTSLPVAVDATCSGLQILAGLGSDHSCAALVNVVPGEKPSDAYKTVAELAINNIPERLKPYFDRSVTKRVVMTIPYNATERSNQHYIREAFKKKFQEHKQNTGVELEPLTFAEVNQTTKAVREAVKTVAPSALEMMKWIGNEMVREIKSGKDVITWTTPSGFVVEQKKDKPRTERLTLKVLGNVKITVADGDLGPVPNKHRTSGAPNLIHSLDASLLHLAFANYDRPFTLIHDSVLARATDMDEISSLVRETYLELFGNNKYIFDFAKQINAQTDPPYVGDLQAESVINSTYFFS